MPDSVQEVKIIQMWDEPRVIFASPEAFLREAVRLISEERVAWDPRHATGHDVEQHEAEQLIFWARPVHVFPDPVSGRWRVVGLDRRGRKLRVVASVTMRPDGPWLALPSAFEENKPFGS